jgi:hypothetical protein
MNFYTVYQKTKKNKKNKMSEIPFSAEEQRLGTFQANPSLLYASDMSLRFVITRQMELTMEVLRPAASARITCCLEQTITLLRA